MQLKASLRGHDYATQVQMLAPDGAGLGRAPSVHEAAALGTSGAGAKLPDADKIQQSFGSYDISNVQAHTDNAVTQGSRAMGADAYATGNHVVLGAGGKDLHTQAHEAAHVVQQQQGVSLSGGVGKAGDAYEQQADAVADRVVQGKSAEDLFGQMGGGGEAAVQRTSSQTDNVQLRPNALFNKDAAGAEVRHSNSTGGSEVSRDGYEYTNPELDDRIANCHQGARDYAAGIEARPRVVDDLPQPLPEYVGYPGYYLERLKDFKRRHRDSASVRLEPDLLGEQFAPRNVPPPFYYFDYGFKYAMRFTNELFPLLSAAGKEWLVNARMNLQLAIENRLQKGAKAFADLEERPNAFRDVCYATHSKAYLDAGLAKLPMEDLYQIGMTPDGKDLFDPAGLNQIREVAIGLYGNTLDVAGETANALLAIRLGQPPKEPPKCIK